jgi:hypothetical protein
MVWTRPGEELPDVRPILFISIGPGGAWNGNGNPRQLEYLLDYIRTNRSIRSVAIHMRTQAMNGDIPHDHTADYSIALQIGDAYKGNVHVSSFRVYLDLCHKTVGHARNFLLLFSDTITHLNVEDRRSGRAILDRSERDTIATAILSMSRLQSLALSGASNYLVKELALRRQNGPHRLADGLQVRINPNNFDEEMLTKIASAPEVAALSLTLDGQDEFPDPRIKYDILANY